MLLLCSPALSSLAHTCVVEPSRCTCSHNGSGAAWRCGKSVHEPGADNSHSLAAGHRTAQATPPCPTWRHAPVTRHAQRLVRLPKLQPWSTLAPRLLVLSHVLLHALPRPFPPLPPPKSRHQCATSARLRRLLPPAREFVDLRWSRRRVRSKLIRPFLDWFVGAARLARTRTQKIIMRALTLVRLRVLARRLRRRLHAPHSATTHVRLRRTWASSRARRLLPLALRRLKQPRIAAMRYPPRRDCSRKTRWTKSTRT